MQHILEPCEFRKNGTCELASILASCEVSVEEAACKKCLEHDNPKAFNTVTCGKALYYIRTSGRGMTQELELCLGDKTTGVGEELEKIFNTVRWWLGWIGLAWLVTLDPAKCGCVARRQAMNNDGSIETLKRIDTHSKEIVTTLVKLKPYLLIKMLKIPLYYLIRACILLAIKRNDARLTAKTNENLCNQHANSPR